MLYDLTALVLMGWAAWHLACGKHAGIVGKVLYFLVTIEAGAICFPASWHLPTPDTILPVLAVTIVYQEIIVNYRKNPR